MNWRILHLQMIQKRAKGRFSGKMKRTNSRQRENKSSEEDATSSGMKFVIPWDVIMSDLFLITSYGMEIAAIKFVSFLCHSVIIMQCVSFLLSSRVFDPYGDRIFGFIARFFSSSFCVFDVEVVNI